MPQRAMVSSTMQLCYLTASMLPSQTASRCKSTFCLSACWTGTVTHPAGLYSIFACGRHQWF